MRAKEIKKLYYSIGEVSEITNLKQYVLRYWETEFPSLKPAKNKAGNRTYRKSDIQLINQIKTLLYEKKFTIKGAKQYFKDMEDVNTKADKSVQKIVKLSSNLDVNLLKDLKKSLTELLNVIDEFKD
jgi:DNA-binding transcriptional MerR regulator